MSASTAFANELLTAVLIAQDFGPTYIALHTQDPGAGGNQSTHELPYTGYARRLVDAADWQITANTFNNELSIEFNEATAVAPEIDAAFFTIGTAPNGAGKVLLRGRVTTPQRVNVGTEMRFKPGTLEGFIDTSAPA